MKTEDYNIMNLFDEICLEISTKEDAYGDDIEGSYIKLLNFLTLTGKNEYIIKKIINIVLNFRHAREDGYLPLLSIDAIAYCMHELRWPEIYTAALSEQIDYFSKRKETTLNRLIDAFSDDWDEAKDYERYRN